MIDHLLCFPTESEAKAACHAYVSGDTWDNSRCNTGIDGRGIDVHVPTGTYTEAIEDEPSVEIMARVPGWWVAIATKEPDPDLIALPHCRVVSDRQAIADGRNHFVHLAADVDADILARAIVSPVSAGSKYTF